MYFNNLTWVDLISNSAASVVTGLFMTFWVDPGKTQSEGPWHHPTKECKKDPAQSPISNVQILDKAMKARN